MAKALHHADLLFHRLRRLLRPLRLELDLLHCDDLPTRHVDGLVHLTERTSTEQTTFLESDRIQLNGLREGEEGGRVSGTGVEEV